MKYCITMTELALLTNKTRPTINTYLKAYENNEFDKIPYSFISLFVKLSDQHTTKKDIVTYCEETFLNTTDDITISEIIRILKENKDRLDLKAIKEALEEELENGKHD